MKVAVIVHTNPFESNSASSNRWRGLLEGLSRYPVKIDIYVTGGSNSLFNNNKKLIENSRINVKRMSPLYEGNIWFRRLNKYMIDFLVEPIVKYRILRRLKKGSYKILWISGDRMSFDLLSRLDIKALHMKAFHELNEFLDIHTLHKTNWMNKVKANNLKTRFEEDIIYKLDGLALMTKTLMENYSSSLPKPKLLHLPMTVDLDRFKGESKPPKGFAKPYIVFVGLMNNVKDGVDILIEAFAAIAQEFINYKLYLVGPWNYDTPGHLNQIERHNLQNRVFWMNEFHRDVIPTILKNASLLTLPRPDSKQAQGGFSTKLGEYLASGVPVCATRVGEIPNYLVDNESVFFADPGSVMSFANAMKRALSDSENALEVGRRGQKVAEMEFNSAIQAKKMYDFLSSL